MNRRILPKALLGGAAVLAFPLIGHAQTPKAAEQQVQGKWRTTTDNRIERLSVQVTAYRSDDEAVQVFSEALESVKEGTIYNESIKTFGDESFIVEYAYPYMTTYEATSRVGNLIYFVVWDAIFIDGHVEGHYIFEAVIDRAEVQNDYTEEELKALLPTEEELAPFELEPSN